MPIKGNVINAFVGLRNTSTNLIVDELEKNIIVVQFAKELMGPNVSEEEAKSAMDEARSNEFKYNYKKMVKVEGEYGYREDGTWFSEPDTEEERDAVDKYNARWVLARAIFNDPKSILEQPVNLLAIKKIISIAKGYPNAEGMLNDFVGKIKSQKIAISQYGLSLLNNEIEKLKNERESKEKIESARKEKEDKLYRDWGELYGVHQQLKAIKNKTPAQVALIGKLNDLMKYRDSENQLITDNPDLERDMNIIKADSAYQMMFQIRQGKKPAGAILSDGEKLQFQKQVNPNATLVEKLEQKKNDVINAVGDLRDKAQKVSTKVGKETQVALNDMGKYMLKGANVVIGKFDNLIVRVKEGTKRDETVNTEIKAHVRIANAFTRVIKQCSSQLSDIVSSKSMSQKDAEVQSRGVVQKANALVAKATGILQSFRSGEQSKEKSETGWDRLMEIKGNIENAVSKAGSNVIELEFDNDQLDIMINGSDEILNAVQNINAVRMKADPKKLPITEIKINNVSINIPPKPENKQTREEQKEACRAQLRRARAGPTSSDKPIQQETVVIKTPAEVVKGLQARMVKSIQSAGTKTPEIHITDPTELAALKDHPNLIFVAVKSANVNPSPVAIKINGQELKLKAVNPGQTDDSVRGFTLNQVAKVQLWTKPVPEVPQVAQPQPENPQPISPTTREKIKPPPGPPPGWIPPAPVSQQPQQQPSPTPDPPKPSAPSIADLMAKLTGIAHDLPTSDPVANTQHVVNPAQLHSNDAAREQRNHKDVDPGQDVRSDEGKKHKSTM